MRIRLILNGVTARPTGYTPGSGNSPVVWMRSRIDIPLPQGTDTHTGRFGVVPAMRAAGGGSDIVGSGGATSHPPVYMRELTAPLFDVVSPRSWYYAFYHDRNDNGVYDTGEPVTDDGIQVSPGNSSFADRSEHRPMSRKGPSICSSERHLVYQGNPVLAESGTASVTTTLHSARLQLAPWSVTKCVAKGVSQELRLRLNPAITSSTKWSTKTQESRR